MARVPIHLEGMGGMGWQVEAPQLLTLRDLAVGLPALPVCGCWPQVPVMGPMAHAWDH